jgi:phosphoribosylamine--glycine ligase
VVEEFMNGIEMSVFVLTDGKHYVILPEAKDYKRIDEGDKGPNTGGMGAVSPVPFADESLMKKLKNALLNPQLKVL